MPSDTELFLADPKAFLATTVLIATEQLDRHVKLADGRIVHQFKLSRRQRNTAWLTLSGFGAGEAHGGAAIKAYYLPWKADTCQTMTLTNEADYFFTSHLTNCRFSVIQGIGGVSGTVKVGHTAGTGKNSAAQRDEWDAAAKFLPRAGTEEKRVFDAEGGRRISELRTRGVVTRQASDKKHEYRGQLKIGEGESSAFIVGHRLGGAWRFYAQVTRNHRDEACGKPLETNIEIIPFRGEPVFTI